MECYLVVNENFQGCNAIIETATNTLVAGCKNTVIPKSVTAIGNNAFRFSIAFAVKYVAGLELIYDKMDYNPSAKVVIPKGVVAIGNKAFEGCDSLLHIDISNSVVTIGSDAFSGCEVLEDVKIPNSVRNIGKCAFSDCSRIKFPTV